MIQSVEQTQFVLKASCPSNSGIVAKITSFLFEHGCYIKELNQFDDPDSGNFFLRAFCAIEASIEEIDNETSSLDIIKLAIADLVAEFDMQWQIHNSCAAMKVLLMVSKIDHCLDDLMYRYRKGELNIEITAIVSNHKDLRAIAEREGIRFIHLPVTKDNKREQELALLNVIAQTDTALVVLARYMQVLTDNLCSHLSGRAINIHHSFLPGFKGAKPYHQAYERGVKLIGATAHYVTSDLDEGPIIEQAVQEVDHNYSPEQLVAVGRDTETQALAKAVKLHVEHRVFLDGNKTVIFK
jgi:formyltetrahydrofolate deformylase